MQYNNTFMLYLKSSLILRSGVSKLAFKKEKWSVRYMYIRLDKQTEVMHQIFFVLVCCARS